ncbi:MAG: ATP-binding protein [bacterium]
MKKSIFLKIFSGYFFIILGLSSLILVSSFITIRKHYIGLLVENLQNLGTTLTLKLEPIIEEHNFQELDSLVKRIGFIINTRITIIDSNGIVLADSQKDPKSMENHKTRPEVGQALEGHIGKSWRLSTTVKEEMLYVALPIKRQGRIFDILRLSLSVRNDINRLLNNLMLQISQVILIIMVLSLLGAFLLSKNLSKPIKELSIASNKVAQGDFNVKVFIKNNDELSGLANSFNHMTEQIKTLFTELVSQKEELTNIISSIQEGLVLLDKKGKIILFNESMQKIVPDSVLKDKFYWEVLRNPKLNALVKKVQNEKQSSFEEIDLNDKTFLCGISYMTSKEEIVLIFHDITKNKELEKIKRDFVVNVSHELKTPLTVIKGFTETLESEVNEKSKHFLDIIKNHTDRLINIIQDLLVLSELEEKKNNLNLEQVNLQNLIENVAKIFEQKLKGKQLNLEINVDSNIPPIKADAFKIEQMFINLIDNAIKYTENGKIKVSCTQEETNIKIEIEDTGIGIPQEYLARIFERFYVVDKSRSRKSGGTGLGLSIVKHIVLLHNGTINVESEPGQGTNFSITLPN